MKREKGNIEGTNPSNYCPLFGEISAEEEEKRGVLILIERKTELRCSRTRTDQQKKTKKIGGWDTLYYRHTFKEKDKEDSITRLAGDI